MKRSFLYTFVLVFLVAIPVVHADVQLELDKSTVDISAFYDGTAINCEGTVPGDADVIIRVSGQPEDLHLKKKGKAAGLLWMNVGDFSFANAPKVYMLYTSNGAEKTLNNKNMEFSYPALADRVDIEPAGSDKEKWFGEFLKLKKHDGVYGEFSGAVTKVAGQGGNSNFKAELAIPPLMGRGQYTVTVYAVENGTIIGQTEKKLVIRLVGFPKKLTELAYNKALIYGIFSVLIALVAGLFMGIVFKDKGGAH